ncbi:MAG: SPOR domain-containing protein [Spirochaetaceae bacterium]|jgi:DedD protein|nr:SPOR domain-containing protein [Spirochaetaceae bacterium]
MDKKKLLLVAASVGMFLVIVFGAAILVFTPRTKTDGSVIAGTNDWMPPVPAGGGMNGGGIAAGGAQTGYPPPAGTVPPGWTQERGVPPVQSGYGQQPPVSTGYETGASSAAGAYAQPVDGGGYADGTGSYNVHGGVPAASGDVRAYGETPPAAGRDGRTVISVPSPVNAGVPQTAPRGSAPAVSQSTVMQKEAPQQAPRAQTKPVAVKKPVEMPEAVKKAGYWVQTGSYVKKSSADSTKDFLNTKGIASIVTNTNVDGRVFYRVRVGPYVSKNEADYWLSLIKTIDGMENSQIWKNGTL